MWGKLNSAKHRRELSFSDLSERSKAWYFVRSMVLMLNGLRDRDWFKNNSPTYYEARSREFQVSKCLLRKRGDIQLESRHLFTRMGCFVKSPFAPSRNVILSFTSPPPFPDAQCLPGLGPRRPYRCPSSLRPRPILQQWLPLQ